MTEKLEKRSDINDISCEMQALSYLKGLQSLLGDEKFRSRFPELDGLDEKMTERIKERENNLRQSMKICGLPILTGSELIEGTEAENEE